MINWVHKKYDTILVLLYTIIRENSKSHENT